MRISDWGADVCSSDLRRELRPVAVEQCALGFRTDTIPVGQERLRAEGLPRRALDRKSVGDGKRVSVRVDLGGRRSLTQKQTYLDALSLSTFIARQQISYSPTQSITYVCTFDLP